MKRIFTLLIITISLFAQSQNQTTHEYVDLGLSVNWATCNVGATTPEEYGDYFAWGEVEPKTTYNNWDTYKYYDGSNFTKYTGSDKTVLDPEDDAATANWGGAWRMPTTAEQQEIINNCTWTWTTQNGVNGYKVTGPNGNSIFLPAAGYMNGSSLNGAGSVGDYWSSSLVTDSPSRAYYGGFNSDLVDWLSLSRGIGLSVRPVLARKYQIAVHASNDLYGIVYGSGTFIENSQVVLRAVANSGYKFKEWHDGNTENPRIITVLDDDAYSAIFEKNEEFNGEYQYVDLGLSVNWATYNIGASNSDEYGDYFAWGEVESKETYTWETYKYCEGSSTTLTKYCRNSSYGKDGFTDDKTVLDLEDDVAFINWGGFWRIPTYEEVKELKTQCTWIWTTQNGINGYLVTSNIAGYTDRSIFLPASGGLNDNKFLAAGEKGIYWSSSSDTYNGAYCLDFTSNTTFFLGTYERQQGFTIRPVCPKPTNITSGTCNNLTWEITQDSILNIEGEGALTKCCWEEYVGLIKEVNIGKGITSINVMQVFGGYGVSLDYLNLESINVDEENTHYYSHNGILYYGEKSWFSESRLLRCPPKKSNNFSAPNADVCAIDTFAFENVVMLEEYIIPSTVDSIYYGAFYGCKFKSINFIIPYGVKYLGNAIFTDSNLESINVENSNYFYQSIDGIVYSKDLKIAHLFPPRKKIQNYIIPEGVETISNYFYYISRDRDSSFVENIIFPTTLKLIKSYVIGGLRPSNYHKKLIFKSTNIPTIEPNGIWGTPYGKIIVPCVSLDEYKNISALSDYQYINNGIEGAFDYSFSAVSSDEMMGNVIIETAPACGIEAVIKATPNDGYRFVKWSDEVTDNPRTMVVTQDSIFIAIFEAKTFFITTEVNDESMGSIIGGGEYEVNSEVLLTATPNEGYRFIQWSDGNTENPRMVIVTEDKTYTAEFELNTYALIAHSYSPNMGGVKIILVAEAIEGFEFDGWSDGNIENPRTIILSEDTELYAYFRMAQGGNIVDIETSKILVAEVYSRDGVLHVEGAESDYHVLDMAGRLIYSGRQSALNLPRGVYLVTIAGEVEKVVL